MSRLSEMLELRKLELGEQIRELEKRLKTAPSSRLRISMDKTRLRYYEVSGKDNATGRYLTREESERARILAQSDYEKKVLSLLRREEKLVKALAEYYVPANRKNAEEFYSGPEELLPAIMVPARRELIEPFIQDRIMYRDQWLSEKYEKKGFLPDAPEYYTDGGIRVRSKTEWMIAEMLEKKKIPFYYERPVRLPGMGKIHPDFTVLNEKKRKTMYWEHMGMMDDDRYRESALEKIDAYMRNGVYPGIDLILTHETSAKPIRSKTLEQVINTYLLS